MKEKINKSSCQFCRYAEILNGKEMKCTRQENTVEDIALAVIDSFLDDSPKCFESALVGA